MDEVGGVGVVETQLPGSYQINIQNSKQTNPPSSPIQPGNANKTHGRRLQRPALWRAPGTTPPGSWSVCRSSSWWTAPGTMATMGAGAAIWSLRSRWGVVVGVGVGVVGDGGVWMWIGVWRLYVEGESSVLVPRSYSQLDSLRALLSINFAVTQMRTAATQPHHPTPPSIHIHHHPVRNGCRGGDRGGGVPVPRAERVLRHQRHRARCQALRAVPRVCSGEGGAAGALVLCCLWIMRAECSLLIVGSIAVSSLSHRSLFQPSRNRVFNLILQTLPNPKPTLTPL